MDGGAAVSGSSGKKHRRKKSAGHATKVVVTDSGMLSPSNEGMFDIPSARTGDTTLPTHNQQHRRAGASGSGRNNMPHPTFGLGSPSASSDITSIPSSIPSRIGSSTSADYSAGSSSAAGIENSASEAGSSGIFSAALGTIKEWTNDMITAPSHFVASNIDANDITQNDRYPPAADKPVSRVRSLSPWSKQRKQASTSTSTSAPTPANKVTSISGALPCGSPNGVLEETHQVKLGEDKMHPMARMRKELVKRASKASRALSPKGRSGSSKKDGPASPNKGRADSGGGAGGGGAGGGHNHVSINDYMNDEQQQQQRQQQPAPPSEPTAEEIISEKHRRWRERKKVADAAEMALQEDNYDCLANMADATSRGTNASAVAATCKGTGTGMIGPVQLLQQMMSQNCMAHRGELALYRSSDDDEEDHDVIYEDRSSDDGDSYSEYTSGSEYEDESQSHLSRDTGDYSGSTRKSQLSRRGRSRGPSNRRERDLYTNSSVSRRKAAEKEHGRSGRRGSRGKGGGGRRSRSRSRRRESDSRIVEESVKSEEDTVTYSSPSNSLLAPAPAPTEEDLSVIGRPLGGGVVRDNVAAKAKKNEAKVAASIEEKEKVDMIEEEDLFTDGAVLKSFVEQLTKEGLPLIWHKVQDSDMYMRPTSIRAFIRLEDDPENFSHSDPCLMWDVVEDSKPNDTANGTSDATRGSIGLFDISSVEKAGVMNLQSYPFAIPGNSFFVTLNNGGVILFEATDEIEQKRFIHGIKWIVARLAFNLIVGNSKICTELLNYGGGEEDFDEEDEARAMDDVTNKLVENSLQAVTNKKTKKK